ncbi:MAG: type VI secretion system-associated protein TagF [Desulfobacteraceae bacterium]|jgi:type VI secretion system protein VasJ
MLGSIIQNRKWNWIAAGKHPVAKDYIRFGGPSPLLDAVAKWSDNGYRQLKGDKQQQSVYHSWRFWLKGVKKGTLICGLGRDSSDSIGRPYPLLIMGEGDLKGWEKQWSKLPCRLDKAWNRMEYIASHCFDSAPAMEAEIERLNAPGKDTDPAVGSFEAVGGDTNHMDMIQCKSQLLQDGFGLIGLNPAHGADISQFALQCHHRLKECCSEIPRGVFIGGTPQQAYLGVVLHPLRPSDFVKLWSTG